MYQEVPYQYLYWILSWFLVHSASEASISIFVLVPKADVRRTVAFGSYAGVGTREVEALDSFLVMGIRVAVLFLDVALHQMPRSNWDTELC